MFMDVMGAVDCGMKHRKGYGWGMNKMKSFRVKWIDVNGAHGMSKSAPKGWRKIVQHPRFPTSFLYMEGVQRG